MKMQLDIEALQEVIIFTHIQNVEFGLLNIGHGFYA